MVTGVLPFYCADCGNRFMGVAAEWMASAIVAPVKCPKCGSMHTRAWSLLPAKLANAKYQKVWEYIDNQS